MAAPDTTQQQRTTLRLLSSTINYDQLRTNCPLDYGKHIPTPSSDLGDLQMLPLELRHHVLGFVDIKSLLTFRRVNKNAMIAVDGMTEYYKVIALAPDCIRLALGIQTADSFTIKELFSKLCQRQCDGKGCNTLAPYMDVFMLTRRCLSISGGCPFPHGPVSLDMFANYDCLVKDPLPPHSFLTVIGEYGSSPQATLSRREREVYYDYDEVKAAIWSGDSRVAKLRFEAFDHIAAEDDMYWSLTSVKAPWLDKIGTRAEYGVFCNICVANEACSKYSSAPDLSMVPFMRLPDLTDHMEKYHKGEVTQGVRLAGQEAQ